MLTERRDHLEQLAERLRGFVRHLVVLQGEMTPRQRQELGNQLANVPDREERLVLATGRYIGEGFDDARLDTLFLAMPISWKGSLVQYAGRLHRLHPRKKEVRIFDYVDVGVRALRRMFEKRLRTYRAVGYARGEAPLGYSEAVEEPTIEYDEEVSRLWLGGVAKKGIARPLGLDPKTVRRYVEVARASGLDIGLRPPGLTEPALSW